eukprot:6060139-Amphidinium_carterae.1
MAWTGIAIHLWSIVRVPRVMKADASTQTAMSTERSPNLFITAGGECYHCDGNYIGLRRRQHPVQARRPCMNCVGCTPQPRGGA